jgi:hypothetical protein
LPNFALNRISRGSCQGPNWKLEIDRFFLTLIFLEKVYPKVQDKKTKPWGLKKLQELAGGGSRTPPVKLGG